MKTIVDMLKVVRTIPMLSVGILLTTGCAIDGTAPHGEGEGMTEDVDSTSQELAAQIPHNQVQSFPAGATSFAQHYQPRLKVNGGCVPFPAVQADGRWSGGLESSGSQNGGCSGSTGQVYTRYETYDATHGCAVMYSWYFPKDGNVFSGHRHDWEGIVVWLKACNSNADPIAVAYSQHGGWYVERGRDVDIHRANGKVQPKVQYHKSTLFTNFELGPSRDAGGEQPLIGWAYMTAAARATLNSANFGKATVPFKDSNFHTNIGKAKYW